MESRRVFFRSSFHGYHGHCMNPWICWHSSVSRSQKKTLHKAQVKAGMVEKPMSPRKKKVLLMVQKSGDSPVWYGKISQYVQVFLHPRWLFGTSSIDTNVWQFQTWMASKFDCLIPLLRIPDYKYLVQRGIFLGFQAKFHCFTNTEVDWCVDLLFCVLGTCTLQFRWHTLNTSILMTIGMYIFSKFCFVHRGI